MPDAALWVCDGDIICRTAFLVWEKCSLRKCISVIWVELCHRVKYHRMCLYVCCIHCASSMCIISSSLTHILKFWTQTEACDLNTFHMGSIQTQEQVHANLKCFVRPWGWQVVFHSSGLYTPEYSLLIAALRECLASQIPALLWDQSWG